MREGRLNYGLHGSSSCSVSRQLSLRTFDEKQAAFSLKTEHIHSNIPGNRHLPELMCLPHRDLCRSKEEIAFPVLVISGAPVALGPRWRNPIVSV